MHSTLTAGGAMASRRLIINDRVTIMRKLLAIIVLCVASPAAAQTQTPSPASQPKPPAPILSADVTDSRLRSIFDAWREAMIGLRYDEALRLADEGIAAAPNNPSFWLSRADALLARASASYNKFGHASDEEARKAGVAAAKQDYRDAVAAATRGLALINELPPSGDDVYRSSVDVLRRVGLWLRASALMACAVRVDESYNADALAAVEQYAGAETDPAMLLLAHSYAGQMMLATNSPEAAADEFRKVLDAEPDDLDALLGEAVSLVNSAYTTGDPAKLGQGLDYLRRFVEKAPERHRVRASAVQALEYLKSDSSPLAGKEPDDQQAGPARTIEGGIITGRAISKPAPPYPAIAKAARARGSVAVHVVVDERGDVVSARATSGHPLLRAAAVEAAKEAKFTPTLLSGSPVRVSGVITYNFALEQ